MKITLGIFIFLATHIHSASIHSNNSLDIRTTTDAPFFDTDKFMAEISAAYMTCADFEQMAGNVMRYSTVRMIADHLIGRAVLNIGRIEFREALNFAPLNTSKPHNITRPNEEELASAPTLEAYYDMKESDSVADNFDNMYLLESNTPPVIAFFDKRFPSIRALFRKKIQEIIRVNEGKMSKETVDGWMYELLVIRSKIFHAFKNIKRQKFYECVDS